VFDLAQVNSQTTTPRQILLQIFLSLWPGPSQQPNYSLPDKSCCKAYTELRLQPQHAQRAQRAQAQFFFKNLKTSREALARSARARAARAKALSLTWARTLSVFF